MADVAGVSLGYWQDRDPAEAITTAALAAGAGHRCLWIGEMATYDAVALATAVGLRHPELELVVGPLAPAIRDPAALAMGVASASALTGRTVHLALGASSPVVVARWHGRTFGATAAQLRDAIGTLRALLAGDRDPVGGYRLRLPPVPDASITVAAFGPATVRVAGELADRMVVNMCTPDQVRRLRAALDAAAAAAGRERVRLAAWVPAAVDPTAEGVDQLRRGVVAYLAAPGYAQMFAAAGFGALVDTARAGAHPGVLLRQVPRALVDAVGAVGDLPACRARIAELVAAGVDEVVIVPATAGDDGGRRTLAALAPAVSGDEPRGLR